MLRDYGRVAPAHQALVPTLQPMEACESFNGAREIEASKILFLMKQQIRSHSHHR